MRSLALAHLARRLARGSDGAVPCAAEGWVHCLGLPPCRGLAQAKTFDADLKRLHRIRGSFASRYEDRLQNEVARNLVDRLRDCSRTFKDILIVGGCGVSVARQLVDTGYEFDSLTYVDPCSHALETFQKLVDDKGAGHRPVEVVKADDAALIDPLSKESFDAAISCLGMHWINDLPSFMSQVRRTLKPDGLFLGGFLGGETVNEMRIACSIAELEREGGVSPRTSPLARVRDAGSLLSATGFALPVVDVDTVIIRYASVMDMVEHLRDLGESNAHVGRRPSIKRDTALAAAAVYEVLFQEDDKTLPLTFQVLYISGWSPHKSQQAPLERGSAQVSIKDLGHLSSTVQPEGNQ